MPTRRESGTVASGRGAAWRKQRMSPFISGKDLEDRLKSRLKDMGCLIESKEKYDHEFKLDFMVYRLAGFEKPPPISVGGEGTAEKDDFGKQRGVFHVQR